MKTRTALPLTLAGLALAAAAAHAQNAPAAAEPAQSPATEAAERPARDTTGGLRFNFRGAPLETVLNYLSEAAGFVIVLETPVRGNIDMWSAQPVSRSEAVQLLNLAINKSGYTATLKGRTLVVSQQIRRVEGGDWTVSAPRTPPADPRAGSGRAAEAVPVEIPANASEVLKRLMKQREQQLKK